MKVFISVDMEGVSGIVSREEVNPKDGRDYPSARKAMTMDVNAAIKGAVASGATEVWVRDSHAEMTNLILDELDPSANVVKGGPTPLSMVESLNETFDCMFLIGYHSMSGTLCSVLDHTYSGRCVSEIRINGRPSGEFVMSAMVAGYYGVPVALISGDYGVVQQAREVIPNIVGVEVKKGISRYSAGCIHPEVARKKIYSGAKEAIKLVRQKKITPFNAGSPIEIQLDLVNTGMADLSSMMPCAERTGPRTIKYIAKDPIEAYKFIVCAVTLASIT